MQSMQTPNDGQVARCEREATGGAMPVWDKPRLIPLRVFFSQMPAPPTLSDCLHITSDFRLTYQAATGLAPLNGGGKAFCSPDTI